MKELGKLRTVCNELDRYNIQVLRICEFNWNEYGSFKTEEKESSYNHGIAMILAKKPDNTLIIYSPVYDTIMSQNSS